MSKAIAKLTTGYTTIGSAAYRIEYRNESGSTHVRKSFKHKGAAEKALAKLIATWGPA